jgi:hypothetical protein
MTWRSLLVIGVCLVRLGCGSLHACCAVAGDGLPVVNADQTVILWWDRANQTEHFIRRASFRGGGDSVGFLVPSPGRPQLEEAGDGAFPYLANLTRPESPSGGFAIGCAVAAPPRSAGVQVIEEKTVAGYDAVVLAAGSGEELLKWLNQNGYAFRPETAAWAEPYVKNGWYISAMKIAKKQAPGESSKLAASALRISFKTDRPLFPYREPDSRSDASRLGVENRLLRIYFVGDGPYRGRFPSGASWQATVRHSAALNSGERARLVQLLGLPPSTGPAQAWLTEFEHEWPYGLAPGDVYFEPSLETTKVQRAGIPADVSWLLVGGWFAARLCRQVRFRKGCGQGL